MNTDLCLNEFEGGLASNVDCDVNKPPRRPTGYIEILLNVTRA